jgi:uncharacterized membrane protein YjgN (DUF898 family)
MQPATAPAGAPAPQRVEFLGSGGEYFRIWIVNVLLTLLTLGIYSAWAKVRREQWFHRNTRVAGAGFDWDGSPGPILRGRLLALALPVAFQLGSQVSPIVGLAGGAVFVVALPWLVTAALRFRLFHTLHRGLRFGFRRTYAEAAQAFLLWPLAAAATLGALAPLAVQRQQRFLYGGGSFGTSPFESAIPARAVYGIYARGLGMILGLALVAGAAAAALGAFGPQAAQAEDPRVAFALPLAALAMLGGVGVGAWFQVRLQNLAWNHLELGPHRFRSDWRVRSFLALQLGNLLGLVLTLGLFRPWAAVRAARYRAQHTALVPGGSLDEFAAGASRGEAAAADEIAELFGFDVGF